MAKNTNQGWAMLTGAALGGGLMYLLDPDRGNRRRKMLRDQFYRGLHVAADSADKSVRDLQNRARGTVAETWSVLRREEVADETLEQRVRARLGRAVSHPSAIEVATAGGTVTLRGPILENEVDDAISETWRVRGVRKVENRLEAHKEAGDIPGLQGGAGPKRGGRRFDLWQENWAPGTRVIMGAGGALLAGVAPRRAFRVLGIGMTLRALTNLSLRRLFGLGASRRGIEMQKTIELNAPVERVYELWSNPENFPKFMEHVREVSKSGDRYHWTIAGPAGVSVSFDTHITEQIPNQVLAWKSMPGEMIRNAGIVRFQRTEGGTRLHILMSYNPPGGALAHIVAAIFGSDPKRALDDDIARLKSLLELGNTTAHGEKVEARPEGAVKPRGRRGA